MSLCSACDFDANYREKYPEQYNPEFFRLLREESNRKTGCNMIVSKRFIQIMAGVLLLCLVMPVVSGSKIAFSHRVAFGNYEIYVMNADGSAVINLTNNPTNDQMPAWSPDGMKIAFWSNRDGNNDIYVMNTDGSGVTRLTTNGATDEFPAWSPDSTKIAFVSYRDANYEIYVMNADGTGQTRLTNNPAVDMSPTWSADGTKIAFGSDRDANYEIYVMNADGTGQTRLTNNPASDNFPTWSADGTKIAFETDRDIGREIYVMNADGTGQTRLTNNLNLDENPAWSADGTKIAFVSDRDGNNEIYVMNADGTGQTRLTNDPEIDGYPSWGPSGSIQVQSSPAGAWILLDDADDPIAPVTPFTLSDVSPGPHKITVGKPSGWLNASCQVTVTAGATSVVTFDLDPVPTTLDSDAQQSLQMVLHDKLGDDTTGKSVSAVADTIYYAPDGSGKPTVGLWGNNAVSFTDNSLDSCSLVAVDNAPEANWEHPVTYYCVDADDKKFESHDAFSPATNYQFVTATGESPSPGEDWQPDDPYVWRPTCVNDCTNNYALLISGGNDMNTNYRRYWNDIAFMYINLIEYGYAPSHIAVLMADGSEPANDRCIAGYPVCTGWDSSPQDLDGNNVNEVILPATKSQIQNTLAGWRPASAGGTNPLPANANLLVFTTAHGGNDTVPGSNNARIYTWYGANPTSDNQYITDDDFIGYLNSLSQLNSITLIMENCYSGGFHDEFITGTQKRVIMTATNGDESSWGNGFSNAVTTAMAGHTRYFTSTCNPDNPTDICRAQLNKNADEPVVNPDGSANGDQRVSAKEAFYYAKAIDPYTTTITGPVPGKEHPSLSYTGTTDLVNQFISACTAPAAKSITVQNPAINVKWPAGQMHVITWTAKGLADKNVKITLYKGTIPETTPIAASVPADRGYFEWTILPTQAAATNYKIRIDALSQSPLVIGCSSTFTIQAVPASNTGKLTINAKDEAGAALAATVKIDGSTSYCSTTTPCTTSSLSGGDHNLELILNNPDGTPKYYPFSTFVSVTAGSTLTKTYTLMLVPTGQNADLPPFGGLDVSSSPGNAEIWVGRTGTTLYDTETTTPTVLYLEPGDYDVYVTKDGYLTPDPRTVKVERLTPGRLPVKVTFDLESSDAMRYTIDGFYAPVDMNGIVNSAKAGQAVPVKWHLGNNMGDVSDPASFVALRSYPVSCTDYSGDPEATIDEYAAGNSGLQYNGEGNWQYNWKTSKAYSRTCRNMYVVFINDQQSDIAKFKFK